MSLVSPYAESETFPRGRRVLLVPFAGAFLVGPYGVMLAGGPSAPIAWLLTAIAIGVGAFFAGLAIAVPRRTLKADGDDRIITVQHTAPLPHIQHVRERHTFEEVTATLVEEVGTKGTKSYGVRPVLLLDDGDRVVLKRQPDHEYAQDVVDHLVLLGLPGSSRADQRAAQLTAEPPTTWL